MSVERIPTRSMFMTSRRLIIGAIALLFPIAPDLVARADPVTVLGTANIFSAGNNAANLSA